MLLNDREHALMRNWNQFSYFDDTIKPLIEPGNTVILLEMQLDRIV